MATRIGRDRARGFGRRLAGATALAIVAGLLPFDPGTAGAASLRLPDTTYNYMVIDQDLPAALQEFGSNLKIKVSISPEVKGRIQGRITEGSAQAFLDRLSALYNLEWYYDGSVLYLSSAKENRTQLLVLSPISYDRLKSALDALDISDPRFPARPAPGKGLIMVSGPPRYVALMEQTLAGLVAEEAARPKPAPPPPKPESPPKVTVLTVFRGNQMTVFRDGRPERLIGPEADAPPPRAEAASGLRQLNPEPASSVPAPAAP